MKFDPKSNFVIADSLPATTYAVGTHAGQSVDFSLYPAASFHVSIGDTSTTSGTLALKLQESADNSAWSDRSDTTFGNDTGLATMTVSTSAGQQSNCHITNPTVRYARPHITIATAEVKAGVVSVAGPKRSVAAE